MLSPKQKIFLDIALNLQRYSHTTGKSTISAQSRRFHGNIAKSQYIPTLWENRRLSHRIADSRGNIANNSKHSVASAGNTFEKIIRRFGRMFIEHKEGVSQKKYVASVGYLSSKRREYCKRICCFSWIFIAQKQRVSQKESVASAKYLSSKRKEQHER